MSDIATLRRVLAGYRPGTQITICDLRHTLVDVAQVKPNALGPLLKEGCQKGLLSCTERNRASTDPLARGRRVMIYEVLEQIEVAA
jgi:hypothetical protein